MLWGRRSKGKRLPGLVRYGQVVGDLDQIEEWNEYGELQEHINSTHDSSTPVTSSPASAGITLRPEPPPGVANQPTEIQKPQRPSGPPSRASSEGRHISISEPTETDKEKARTPSTAPVENPMLAAMRQLGSEAAAKGQARKVSGGIAKDKSKPEEESTSPVSIPTQSTTAASTAQTPSPAATRQSIDAADPSEDPEMTAGKVPAQLAAEGARRTSVDKIEEQTPSTSSPLASSNETTDSTNKSANDGGLSPAAALSTSDKSNQQQTIELRRTSTQTKQPSALQHSESVNDVPQVGGDDTEQAEKSATENEIEESASKVNADETLEPNEHRGSTLEKVDTVDAKEIEEKNAIPEDPEKEEEDDEDEKDEGDVNDKAKATESSSIANLDTDTSTAKSLGKDEDTRPQQTTTTKESAIAPETVDD